MLSFSQVVGIGTPPTPHPQASVPSPRFWGEGHTRERGWESPNSDEGTYTVVLFIYTYFLFEIMKETAREEKSRYVVIKALDSCSIDWKPEAES